MRPTAPRLGYPEIGASPDGCPIADSTSADDASHARMFDGASPAEIQSPPRRRRFVNRRCHGVVADPAPRRLEATLNALERLLERHGTAAPEATAKALSTA